MRIAHAEEVQLVGKYGCMISTNAHEVVMRMRMSRSAMATSFRHQISVSSTLSVCSIKMGFLWTMCMWFARRSTFAEFEIPNATFLPTTSERIRHTSTSPFLDLTIPRNHRYSHMSSE